MARVAAADADEVVALLLEQVESRGDGFGDGGLAMLDRSGGGWGWRGDSEEAGCFGGAALGGERGGGFVIALRGGVGSFRQ